MVGGSPLLPGSPLPTLSHGLCSAVVVGSGWGSAPGPPPVPPVEAPSPVRSQGSATPAPFQQLHRPPSKASEGGSGPRIVPPQPQVPQGGSDQCKTPSLLLQQLPLPAPTHRGSPLLWGRGKSRGWRAPRITGGGHRGGKRGAGAAVGTWGRRGTWLAPSCYRGRGRGAVLGGSCTRCRQEEEDEELLGVGEGGAPALVSLLSPPQEAATAPGGPAGAGWRG